MKVFAAIKRVFARLLQWRHDPRIIAERFEQIDVAKAAVDLLLADVGKKRGRRNQPDSNSSGFDDVEQRVILDIERTRSKCQDQVSQGLAAYDQKLATFTYLSKLDEVKASAQVASTEFQRLRRQGRDEILKLEDRVQEANDELVTFRQRHSLEHQLAVYPDSQTLRWGILLVVVVFESVTNGVIFAASNSFGVVGGIVYAFVLSVLNVGVGWLVGKRVLPYFNWHRTGRRLLASVGFLLYLIAILGINLLAAHYRDISRGTDALHLDLVLIPKILSTPFALKEFSSWALFVLGVIFSLVAALDGYSMDDRYPGYGGVARRAIQAKDDYNSALSDVYDHAQKIRDAADESMSAVFESAEREIGYYRILVEGRQSLLNQYKDYLRHLEQAANGLLEVYRAANRETRRTPSPSSFGMRWTIGYDDELLRDLPESLEAARVNNQVQRGIRDLKQLRTELHKDHQQTIEVFDTLRELVGKAGRNGANHPDA